MKENIYTLLFEALENSECFYQRFDGLAISNGELMVTDGEDDYIIVAIKCGTYSSDALEQLRKSDGED